MQRLKFQPSAKNITIPINYCYGQVLHRPCGIFSDTKTLPNINFFEKILILKLSDD